MYEQLIVPPFEAELRRSSALAKTATSKAATAAAVDSGTSVAPRQRPKASAPQSAYTLPLVAPPSLSPHNNIASPSHHSAPAPAPTGRPVGISDANETPFSAQFQANFPPVSTPAGPAAAETPLSVAPAIASEHTSGAEVLAHRTAAEVPATITPATSERSPSLPNAVHGSGHALFAAVTEASAQKSPIVSSAQLLEASTVETTISGHRRNVSDTSAFNKCELHANWARLCFELQQMHFFRRTFANETTQFLAPYQVSQQKNSQCFDADFAAATTGVDATVAGPAHSSSSPPPHSSALPAASMSSIEQSMHTRSSERAGEPGIRKKLGKWNPFEDPTPFSQMTEDHIFDAEFDAIRQRGSQNSECS